MVDVLLVARLCGEGNEEEVEAKALGLVHDLSYGEVLVRESACGGIKVADEDLFG